MEARIELLKEQGWEESSLVNACGHPDHWVVSLIHKNHPGLIAAANCSDHRRAWIWTADSPQALCLSSWDV